MSSARMIMELMDYQRKVTQGVKMHIAGRVSNDHAFKLGVTLAEFQREIEAIRGSRTVTIQIQAFGGLLHPSNIYSYLLTLPFVKLPLFTKSVLF